MKLIRKTQPQSKKKKKQKGGYSFHCSKAAIERIVQLNQCSNRYQLLRLVLTVLLTVSPMLCCTFYMFGRKRRVRDHWNTGNENLALYETFYPH